MSDSDLRRSYGIVHLQKGTILYQTSEKSKFKLSPDYPFLFMTMHPLEWEGKYITIIKLKRNVSLLFMIEGINDIIIESALNTFLEGKNSVSAKQNRNTLNCLIPKLQKENLDGWFSSINSKTSIEFAIFNNSSLLKILDTEISANNWHNANNTKEKPIPFSWGNTYIISTLIKPATFIINSRFKSQIDSYLVNIKKSNIGATVFSVILKNAVIYYIDAPIKKIKWC